MATGSIYMSGKVSSSSATYFGNSSTKGQEDIYFTSSISKTGTLPSTAISFSVTSVSIEIACNTTAKKSFSGDLYLGSYKLANFSFSAVSKDGSGVSHTYKLSTSSVSSRTLAEITSGFASNQFSLRNCSASVTGRKFYCKSSYNISSVTVNFSYESNTPPTTPKISLPSANGKTTYNSKPYFKITMGTDAQESSTTLYYKVDSADYKTKASCANDTAYWIQWPTSLSTGSHTLTIYANDGKSSSGTATRTFTVGTVTSAVTAGNIIDDDTIDKLQSNINTQRAYYDFANASFTTCDLGTIALDDHIDQLETAIEALPQTAASAITSVDAGTLATAATINSIRTALLNA